MYVCIFIDCTEIVQKYTVYKYSFTHLGNSKIQKNETRKHITTNS